MDPMTRLEYQRQRALEANLLEQQDIMNDRKQGLTEIGDAMQELVGLAKDINVQLVKDEATIEKTQVNMEAATNDLDVANQELKKKQEQLAK